MKSFSFLQGIERKLLKIFFITLLSFSPSILSFSNPIVPPNVMLEIYFGQWSWEIEIRNNEYFAEYENLDSLWLVGNYDTARFEPGHSFMPGELVVITNYDMLTPMYIEQAGDDVCLCEKWGNYFFPLGGLAWGITYSEVTAPVGEQSIAIQRFLLPEYDWSDWTAKEQPHTINSSPGTINKRAAFSGYVRDKYDQPLENIHLDYCYPQFLYYDSDPTVPIIITNSEGYFHSDNMYCRMYSVYFRNSFWGDFIGDTTIRINLEPDSANYFEFKLDTLLTGITEIKPSTLQYSISNIPNPSSFQTKFIIESDLPKPGTEAVIKIYSENGFIVDIIPVVLNDEKQEVNYNFNDKAFSAGLYFYNLELRNRKVASGKMIISQ
jgi:hypothetical protein